MDRSFFKTIMNELFNAYIKGDKLSNEVYSAWYKYLGNGSEKILEEVVERWIREEPRLPSISDLYEILKKREYFEKQRNGVE